MEVDQTLLFIEIQSPADGDNLGAIWFYGKDSAGNQQQYSAIIGSINDVTAGTE